MSAPTMSNRAFGLSFGVLFGGFAGLAWWLSASPILTGSPIGWLLGLAGVFTSLGLLTPGVLLPANRIWGRIAGGIGRVTNLLLLGLFYYGAVLPVGLLVRLVGGDPANRRAKPQDEGYWRPVERQVSPDTLPDLF